MERKVKVYHEENLINHNPFEGAKVNFVHSERMTFTEWHFDADTPLPEHSHENEQITKVISGTLELTLEGEKHTLTAGSIIVIPSNAVHSARAVTECHVVDCFCPVREDYLKFGS